MNNIYLDHAAATPLDSSVLAAMQPYFTDKFYNPSAMYGAARQVSRDLQAARSKVAQTIGSRPVEVVFTAGGTEANNMAISGVMAQFPGKKVLVSSVEHDSVLEAARPYEYDEIPVDPQGLVDMSALESLVDDETVLISVMYANNEVGSVQPVRQISALVQKLRAGRRSDGNNLPLYLHTDAAQAGNYLDIHVSRLGVDLMTLNGGKIYGPKQSGALYVRAGTKLLPLVRGGGQEHGLRSGTENLAGAVGFAAALGLAQEMRTVESRRLQELQRQFITKIQKALPTAVINGSIKKRLPNNLHITIPGQDNERLLYALDEQGIQAAAGSACSAGSGEPSHVLRAMGLSDAEAQANLRFTLGRSTDSRAIDIAVDTLAGLLAN